MTREEWSDMGQICHEIGSQSTRALEGRRRARFIEIYEVTSLEYPSDPRLGPINHILVLLFLAACSCGLVYYIGRKIPNIAQYLRVIGSRFARTQKLPNPPNHASDKTGDLPGRKRKRASSLGMEENGWDTTYHISKKRRQIGCSSGNPELSEKRREGSKSKSRLSFLDSLDLAREHAELRLESCLY